MYLADWDESSGAQEALLQALHSVKDGQLPLAGGQLWNSFLLPGRRAGTHLDLKASSHKKLSKLLQACSVDFDAMRGLFWREAPEPRGAQLCILLQGRCSQHVLNGPAHAHIAANANAKCNPQLQMQMQSAAECTSMRHVRWAPQRTLQF